MNQSRIGWLSLLFRMSLLLMIVLRCTGIDNPGTVGTATETENVVGIVYKPDGVTPAAYAQVHLLPVDYNPRQGFTMAMVPESTFTDNNGIYRLDSVPQGTYNVLAGGGGTLAFLDSISVADSGKTQVPDILLRAPGSLTGKIEMETGDDPRTVFILVMGTYQWEIPDSSGVFTLRNIAEGTYNVRLLSTLDHYLPLDTQITVTAGTADTLKNPVRMRFTGIPEVNGLRLSYDTLKQQVTLRWNRPVSGKQPGGFRVYRKAGTSAMQEYVSEFSDTILLDGNLMQDSLYEYRIVVLDLNGNEGKMGESVTVRTVSGFIAVDTIGSGSGTQNGSFSQLGTMTVDRRSGAIYCSDVGNRRIQKFDAAGNFESQWEYNENRQISPFAFTKFAIDSLGKLYIPNNKDGRNENGQIDIYDDKGNYIGLWKDSLFYPLQIDIGSNFVAVSEFKRGIKLFTHEGEPVSTIDAPVETEIIALAGMKLIVVSNLGGMSILSYDITSGILVDTLYNAMTSGKNRQPSIWGFKSLRLSADGQGFWVATQGQSTIARFDIDGTIMERFCISGGTPQDVHDDGTLIWVAMEEGYIVKFSRR